MTRQQKDAATILTVMFIILGALAYKAFEVTCYVFDHHYDYRTGNLSIERLH